MNDIIKSIVTRAEYIWANDPDQTVESAAAAAVREARVAGVTGVTAAEVAKQMNVKSATVAVAAAPVAVAAAPVAPEKPVVDHKWVAYQMSEDKRFSSWWNDRIEYNGEVVCVWREVSGDSGADNKAAAWGVSGESFRGPVVSSWVIERIDEFGFSRTKPEIKTSPVKDDFVWRPIPGKWRK